VEFPETDTFGILNGGTNFFNHKTAFRFDESSHEIPDYVDNVTGPPGSFNHATTDNLPFPYIISFPG